MKMFRLIFTVILLISFQVQSGFGEGNPRNIILMIGDGMGVSQVSAARIASGTLNMERFPVVGLLTTHSANSLVTDSAAGGTALSTGHKTNNGWLALSPEQQPLLTVLEAAEQQGKKTGLVTTCALTHATPASFAAHVDSRNKTALIAEQITHSGVDVLLGGGWGDFVPKSVKGSSRSDDNDLLAELAQRMTVIRSAEEFSALGQVDSLAGFFAADHPPTTPDRKPSLRELTHKAIEILSAHPGGFFLMVEGSQIDWAGHDNDATQVIAETIDFDQAVGVALKFAEGNPNTLLVVTADHETGGFAIESGSIEKKEVRGTDFTSDDHTGAMVPLFAYGPGSLPFSGIQDNTSVGKRLIEYIQSGTETINP